MDTLSHWTHVDPARPTLAKPPHSRTPNFATLSCLERLASSIFTNSLSHPLYRQKSSNMGKVHGSLARAGKVEPQEKKKNPKGRAYKRVQYTRRFVNVTMTGGKRKMNPNPGS
ncbi:hypothetical protein N7512_001584 [Penicillium capsulatum]|nr:hypothetical protein N7512_001584 [Penicillium capsulatum]